MPPSVVCFIPMAPRVPSVQINPLSSTMSLFRGTACMLRPLPLLTRPVCSNASFNSSLLCHGEAASKSSMRKRRLPTPPERPSDYAGPYCPILDSALFRFCVACAKSTKEQTTKNASHGQELLQAALDASRDGRRSHAERLFLKAIACNPYDSRSYFLFALQIQRRDKTLARHVFSQGYQVNPKDAALLQAWGLFELKQGFQKRAQTLVVRSVQLQPKNAPVLKWRRLNLHDANVKHLQNIWAS